MSARRSRLAVVVWAPLFVVGSLLAATSPAAAFTSAGPTGAVPGSTVAPASTSVDRTMSTKARTSKSYRASIPLTEWVSSTHARYIIKRESGGNCKAVSPGGTYRGKWQMGAPFWSAYGGKTYASRPDLATCSEQDKVAYKGWVASWWNPWGG